MDNVDRFHCAANVRQAIALRPDNEVPVITEDGVREQAHGRSLPGLAQHLLESRVIGRLLKEGGTTDSTVEDVIDATSVRTSDPPRRKRCHQRRC